MGRSQKKEIALYLCIVLGITYAVFCVYAVLGRDYRSFVPYSMALPALGALAATLAFKGNFGYIVRNLRFNKWIPLGILTVIAVYILSSALQILINAAILKRPESVALPDGLAFLRQIALGIVLGGLSASLEEIGWRGFLQSRLRGTLKSYLFIGVCWSVFHFPQIAAGLIYKGHPVGGLLVHTCVLVSFGVLLCRVRERSSSLISASVMHGLFNALIFTQVTGVILNGNQIVEGISWAVFLFAAAGILLKTRKVNE
ncbi:CAAX protease self-immunity [Sporobacter termitidis DSM 10068]|uniref:CAAX protease self-immunity n=1 Tax=Sporobacter termitidis DSM 10068 TaxID=1123282 RepID=A0A1M5WG51_9FIRM|nr:CPBP family intramembrane glutamic endopeptidase [Sporobacter termitidis]SHH86204.1 CAAX protease self-immunity [Sporobacter termitidis DSM 10068]